MPAPYSYDLRKKAVDVYHRGEKKIAICRLMKISRNTLDLWLQREIERWWSVLKTWMKQQ